MTTAADIRFRPRPLGEAEKFFAAREVALTYILRVEGNLDIEVLRRAFDALVVQNPVLKARVVDNVLEPRDSVELPFEVRTGDPDEFSNGYVKPFKQNEFLARVEVVQDGAVADVGLTLSHVIADGNAAVTFLGGLWANYTSIVEAGAPLAITPRSIPFGPQHVIDPATVPPLAGLPVAAEFLAPASHLAAGSSAPVREIIRLTRAETTALAARVRELGATVHTAVTGAVLATERSLIPQDGPLPMLVRSSVDFRALLPTPIEVLDGTNFFGIVMTGVNVAKSDSVLTVGEEVIADMRAHVADGSVQYGSVRPWPTKELEAVAPPVSYITNVGRIPAFTLPSDLRGTRMGFLKLYLPAKASMYGVFTYAGELTIDISLPSAGLDEAGRAELVRGIRDRLLNV